MVFTQLDLHNPTKRQRILMLRFGITYYDGMSWIQAKTLIKEAVYLRKRARSAKR